MLDADPKIAITFLTRKIHEFQARKLLLISRGGVGRGEGPELVNATKTDNSPSAGTLKMLNKQNWCEPSQRTCDRISCPKLWSGAALVKLKSRVKNLTRKN